MQKIASIKNRLNCRKISIERVDNASPEAIAARLRTNVPVIFSGSIRDWPAAEKWKPDYFAKDFADFQVHLYSDAQRDVIPCVFPEFIDYMTAGQRRGDLAATTDKLYLAWNSEVLAKHRELRSHFDFRPFFGARRGKIQTGLWMGAEGSHTRLHTDIDSYNLHAVLHGEKEFILFDPSESENLYPSDVYEWTTEFSSVDLRAIDPQRFPKVDKATAYVGDVRAGDMIFVPIGWWHSVTCVQPSISLNAWLFDKRLFWSTKLYRDIGKSLAHRLGWYRRGRCTCHGNPAF